MERIEAPFYNELLQRKNDGETLDFSKITREELKTLYLEEERIQSEIIDLFDVTQNQLKYKLSKWNLKITNYIREKFNDKLSEKYSDNYLELVLKEGLKEKIQSLEVAQVLCSIKNMSETEQSTIFDELIMCNDDLRNLRNDALKYRAINSSLEQMNITTD